VREVAEHAAASAREHGPVVLASVSRDLAGDRSEASGCTFVWKRNRTGCSRRHPAGHAQSATEFRVVNPRKALAVKILAGGHIWRASAFTSSLADEPGGKSRGK
jgi:hypothetical protein